MKGADLPAARAVRGHCQAHRKEEREWEVGREGGRGRVRGGADGAGVRRGRRADGAACAARSCRAGGLWANRRLDDVM